jgi:flavin-dependent dehydrogenase
MYCDTIVAGGGPAGSSLALVLARAGQQVALINDDRPRTFKAGEGLVPAAKRILRDLGVWEGFLAQGHLPSYGNDSMWGSEEVQSTDFTRSIDGHGWRLDRLRFDQLIFDEAKAAGAKTITGFVEKIEGQAGDWQLLLRDGQTFNCATVVDATGRSARIARQLGAIRIDIDQLVAFHMNFKPGVEGDRYASSLIESVSDGWWYNALLPNGNRVVYFFTDAGDNAQKYAKSLTGFLSMTRETTFVNKRLSEYHYEPLGTPTASDARSAYLNRICGEGWLAVGDAAKSFDPLSSQGIFTSLYAGMLAGKALLNPAADALDSYQVAMDEVWNTFLLNRKKYYQSERRWVNEGFWERRFE